MPLKSGNSESTISKNIAELMSTGKYSEKQAAAIAYSNAGKDQEVSAKEYDFNGWPEIKGNPISKVGVFPYLGAQIHPDLEPDKVYNVYRPESELNNTETMESFKLLPWTDEHEMLGSEDEGMTPAEKKGIHGVIGEDVYFEDNYLKANIKIFSEKLAQLIEDGKKELSIGYRCLYDIQSGTYDGQRYDAIQRDIRGNHLALVDEGRSGPDVAVMDHFKTTFDTKDLKMPDYKKEESKDKAKDEGEMSMAEMCKMLRDLSAKVDKMQPAADEDEEGKKELSEEAAKEGDAKDEGDPADFVKKAEVTDTDESEKEYSDEEAKKKDMEMNDEDMDKPEGAEPKVSGMDSKIRKMSAEIKELRSTGTKTLLREISQRDTLAHKLSQHIGTFDHATKTFDEVAKYGIKKLGLTCKPGHESSVLDGYLAGAKVSEPINTGMDTKTAISNDVDKYLAGSK